MGAALGRSKDVKQAEPAPHSVKTLTKIYEVPEGAIVRVSGSNNHPAYEFHPSVETTIAGAVQHPDAERIYVRTNEKQDGRLYFVQR